MPFPISDPERIPAQRYYDEEFYKAEVEHLWPHVWQMACRLEQIPSVGDWFVYTNLGKSIIVVRTEEGVKAFHNACRHRGVPIAGGPGGDHGNCKANGFVCPFHGWRFSMDGENTLVYGSHLFSEHQLDPKDLALVPCRVEEWGGCAFINFDDDAPSVRESLGPVADRLEAHNVHKLRAEWWYSTVLPANWKIAMEAFMEGYHVRATHPQLHQALGPLYDGMYETGYNPGPIPEGMSNKEFIRAAIGSHFRHIELMSEGMAGMIHEKEVEIARQLLDVDLPDNPAEAIPMWYGIVQDQITKQLQAKGEPVPDLNAVAVSDPVHAVEFLFPHYFLLPFFSSVSAYRIRPLGPESCIFELWSLTAFPEGEEPEPVMEPTVLPYDSPEFPPIPRQDYSNIPLQQLGLHAKGFEFMRLSKSMEGMISNYQRIIDGYLAGVPQQKLAGATHLLGGNFDGPLKELDL
ncbi:MAG TPA: aromatic ring-hydroxylating dioxygenase subunit alpha [Novosphingobium sp.]